MKELIDIIYIQKRLYLFNNKFYLKDSDLSLLFDTNINELIKNNKILKYSSIYINKNYFLDNECIIYIVKLLNTNNALIIYKKIIDSFNLIEKYKSFFKIRISYD